MRRLLLVLVVLCSIAIFAQTKTPISVYGTWLCSNDGCAWSTVRDMTNFDTANHWIIDRGDGKPSVNLVVLSFVNPLKLLNQTNDAQTVNGLPIGMNTAVVNYFKSRNIRVMLSIGGITYVDPWDQALSTNATLLADRAAAVAQSLGVGIEIDYENNTSPNIQGIQDFIREYRRMIPYDATGVNPAARLTIDLAAGDRWLIALTREATISWLSTSNHVLDYANAMVPNKQPNTSGAEANWQEHVTGKPTYAPPVPPLAPAKFTGSVYLLNGSRPYPECNNFSSSLESSTGTWVQTVAPNGAGTTNGMLGYMFWAAECPGRGCTTPPNTCQNGVGTGAKTYAIPIPMLPLRQN
jgi:hypothetical protein